jgi:hypothetical protein
MLDDGLAPIRRNPTWAGPRIDAQERSTPLRPEWARSHVRPSPGTGTLSKGSASCNWSRSASDGSPTTLSSVVVSTRMTSAGSAAAGTGVRRIVGRIGWLDRVAVALLLVEAAILVASVRQAM